MKKFMFIAATAALVLSAACTKTEVTSSNDENIPIGFGAYAGRVLDTKASANNYLAKGTTTFTANTHIGVYAYAGASTTANFMSNIDVNLKNGGADESVDYSPMKYWPKDETKPENALTFIAYYPSNAPGIDLSAFGTSKYGAFDFAVQPLVGDQVDLMVADAVEDQYYSTHTGVVPFVFHHAMTRVLFQMKTDIDYQAVGTKITVNSLEVTNICKEGTFDVADTFEHGNWGGQKTLATFAIPVPGVINNTTALPADETANVFLMLPQDIVNDAKLNIQYTVTDNGTGVETVNNATVQLNTIAKNGSATEKIDSWGKNQNVIYTITIGLNPVKFTASVADWDDATTGAWTI